MKEVKVEFSFGGNSLGRIFMMLGGTLPVEYEAKSASHCLSPKSLYMLEQVVDPALCHRLQLAYLALFKVSLTLRPLSIAKVSPLTRYRNLSSFHQQQPQSRLILAIISGRDAQFSKVYSCM